MNTKALMTASAIVVAGIGLSLLFAPAEFLAHLSAQQSPRLVLFVQLCGAVYLGFAILNWMTRESIIGGIYNRPLAMANFMHSVVGALALLKSAVHNHLVGAIWLVAGVYTVFALCFAYVIFAFTPQSGTRESPPPVSAG